MTRLTEILISKCILFHYHYWNWSSTPAVVFFCPNVSPYLYSTCSVFPCPAFCQPLPSHRHHWGLLSGCLAVALGDFSLCPHPLFPLPSLSFTLLYLIIARTHPDGFYSHCRGVRFSTMGCTCPKRLRRHWQCTQ